MSTNSDSSNKTKLTCHLIIQKPLSPKMGNDPVIRIDVTDQIEKFTPVNDFFMERDFMGITMSEDNGKTGGFISGKAAPTYDDFDQLKTALITLIDIAIVNQKQNEKLKDAIVHEVTRTQNRAFRRLRTTN